MKKAILILSLTFMAIIFIQSWLVSIGGLMFADDVFALGGLLGRIAGLLFALGAAFIMVKAMISMAIFILNALIGIIGGLTTGYYDLFLWGALAAALAVLSYFSGRQMEAPRMQEEGVKEAGRF